jgi:hypothetical protein
MSSLPPDNARDIPLHFLLFPYRSCSRPRPPFRCVAKSTKFGHAHWVVGKWFSFTQCACANFVDFAMQRNGGRGHEKDL